MRERRTGDPATPPHKPGPKPKPGGKIDLLAALERELTRLRSENAELQKHLPASNEKRLRQEKEMENLALRRRIAELERKLAAKPRSPRDPSEMKKGLRTQIRNLNARLRKSRDEPP
jgi:chromosome segregation ATPase